MKRDISLMVGLACGVGGLITGYMIEGGNPLSLFGPSSLVIILGGVFGALFVSFGISMTLKELPAGLKIAGQAIPHGYAKIIELFLTFAEQARREGILSLEDSLSDLDAQGFDPLIRRGLSMVVDGVDISAISDIVDNEIEQYENRIKETAEVFAQAGGFAPTMGIIGTVMGLVVVLSHLAEPESLGHSIASAFIATLYGVSFANIFFLPTANKIKTFMKAESTAKKLILMGIQSVQAGDNPRVVREKLIGYIEEAHRESVREVS